MRLWQCHVTPWCHMTLWGHGAMRRPDNASCGHTTWHHVTLWPNTVTYHITLEQKTQHDMTSWCRVIWSDIVTIHFFLFLFKGWIKAAQNEPARLCEFGARVPGRTWCGVAHETTLCSGRQAVTKGPGMHSSAAEPTAAAADLRWLSLAQNKSVCRQAGASLPWWF